MIKKLLLSLVMAVSLNCQSQSYTAGTMFSGYVNYNPDTLLWYTIAPASNNTVFINLFGDSSNDIELRANAGSSPGGTSAAINIISHNPSVYMRFGRLDSVFIPQYSFWDVTKVAKPLSMGELIDPPGAIWEDTMLYLTDHSSWGGGFKNVDDFVGGEKFIALKYMIGSAVSYAWIKMNFLSKDSAYVMEYSFMEGFIGITEQAFNNNVCIYPNPSSGSFILNTSFIPDFNKSNLMITDLYGREIIYSESASNNETRISLENSVGAGCYILYYKDGKTTFSKRIIMLD
jgi:hypothetical protein